MSSNPVTKGKRRRTTLVPVTTMEEIPVLSDEERARLTASLKEAEAVSSPAKGSITIRKSSRIDLSDCIEVASASRT
jgi:hypothetical protein